MSFMLTVPFKRALTMRYNYAKEKIHTKRRPDRFMSVHVSPRSRECRHLRFYSAHRIIILDRRNEGTRRARVSDNTLRRRRTSAVADITLLRAERKKKKN